MSDAALKDEDGLPKPAQEDLDRLRSVAQHAPRPTRQQWTEVVARLLWVEEMRRKEIEAENAPPGTTAPRLALAEIIDFLHTQHVIKQHSATAPLIELQNDLTDLQDGIVSPRFKPEKVRHGLRRNEMARVGMGARVMSMLMESGESEESAAREVARAWKLEALKLKNFRNRLMRARAKGEARAGVPALALRHYNKPLDDWPGSTPRERAKRILQTAAPRLPRI